jgi:hypothetical protein
VIVAVGAGVLAAGLLPGVALADPPGGPTAPQVVSSTFDYRPLTLPPAASYHAQPQRPTKPSLESLRTESNSATASYQEKYGQLQAGAVPAVAWSPPPFAYDYIESAQECEDNQGASGTAAGWIKNHYAFCRIYKAERGLTQCSGIFIFRTCVTFRADFWVTTIGYGSERNRQVQFLTQIDHISVTAQVDDNPPEPSPLLAAATLVGVTNDCAPLVQVGDCTPQVGNGSATTVVRTLQGWNNVNYFSTIMNSDAPAATTLNPDRLGYLDFWNTVSVTWPLEAGTKTGKSDSQTVRFDTTTYLNLNGNNGAIFNKVRPILNFPVNDPFWAPMLESAQHYQDAMTHPETTVPIVPGKQIPGIIGGDPLTRLYYDQAWRDDNRSTAVATCVQEFGPNYTDGGKQCDEFPFASTQQGASAAHNPQRNFSVRAITGDDNEAAGRWLGAWYSYDRILDGDIFNIRVTL